MASKKQLDLVALSPGWAVHPTANVQNQIEIDCTIPAYVKQGHVSDLIRQGDAGLFRGETVGWKWHHSYGVQDNREFAYESRLSLFNGTESKEIRRFHIEGRHLIKFVFTSDGVEFWIDGKLLDAITEFSLAPFPPGIFLGAGGRGTDAGYVSSIIVHSVKTDGVEILGDSELELHDGAYLGSMPVPEARAPRTHKVFPWIEEGYDDVVNGLINLDWGTVEDGDTIDVRGVQIPPPLAINRFIPAIIAIQKHVKIIASKGMATICGCREVTKDGGFDPSEWELDDGKWKIPAPRFLRGLYNRTDTISRLTNAGTAETGTWESVDGVLIVNTGDTESPPDILFSNAGYRFDLSYQPDVSVDGLHFLESDILNTTGVHTSKPRATDVVFSHCWFQFKGVRLFELWDDWTFRQCDFSESNYGIYTFNTKGDPSANGLTVEGCRGWDIKGGDGHFIGIQNSNDVTIVGNTCWNCGDPNGSITVWGGNNKDLKRLVIEGNVVIDEQTEWAGAINLSGQNPGQPNRKSARIVNNAICNPKHQGIRFNWLDPVLIKGNLIDSPGDHGIVGQNSGGALRAIIVDNRVNNVPEGKQAIQLSQPGSIVK